MDQATISGPYLLLILYKIEYEYDNKDAEKKKVFPINIQTTHLRPLKTRLHACKKYYQRNNRNVMVHTGVRKVWRIYKMNKKKLVGLACGTIAGVLDVIPMILQKITWEANLSAFSMWIVIGFIYSSLDLKLPSAIKGILVSFIIIFPTAILIGWKEPITLLPIATMTLILGSMLGFAIDRISIPYLKKDL